MDIDPIPAADCREVLAMLSDFLDEELPPGACGRIIAHLDRCGACETLAAELRATLRICREVGSGEMPRPLASDVRERLLEAYRRAIEPAR